MKTLIYDGRKYGGFKKCPDWLKDSFRKAVGYTCQACREHEDKVGRLQPHRIIRGVDGGLYVCVKLNHPLNNVKMVCADCHRVFDYSPKKGDY